MFYAVAAVSCSGDVGIHRHLNFDWSPCAALASCSVTVAAAAVVFARGFACWQTEICCQLKSNQMKLVFTALSPSVMFLHCERGDAALKLLLKLLFWRWLKPGGGIRDLGPPFPFICCCCCCVASSLINSANAFCVSLNGSKPERTRHD